MKYFTLSRQTIAAGVAGIIGPITALVFVFYSVTLYPNFSWYNNSLSDIGVSSIAAYFNYPLIFEGLLNIIFAIGLLSIWKKMILPKIGSILILVGGISLALVGIFTENAPDHIHFSVALGYFVLLPIGMITLGTGTLKFKRAYALATIIMGCFALLAIFTFPHGKGIAIPEIYEAVTLSIWIVITAILMLYRYVH